MSKIKTMIDELKATPEGKECPQVVEILEALADQLAKKQSPAK